MRVEPYLDFDGRCEEAIEFYKKAVGAEVSMIHRFKDAPPQAQQPGCGPTRGSENKIMHVSLKIGDSAVMASDGRCQGKHQFHGICLSLTVNNDAQAKKVFDALSQGGTISMPLGKTFFSSSFGMLADKFGVPWMVVVMP